jgi:hypothetical protein
MDRLEIEGFVYAADASPSKVRGKPVEVVVQLAGGETYRATSTITFASPILEGSGRIRQFRVSTEIDNKKVPDEKGELQWLIQPGTEAEMIIHHNPPPPKPVSAPKTISPAATKSGLPGSKVEAYKPVLPSGTKSDTKDSGKSPTKSDAKADGKSSANDGAKTEAKSDVKDGTKSDAAKAEKLDKPENSKLHESKAAHETKNREKSDDAAQPAEKSGKDPAKSPKIKL